MKQRLLTGAVIALFLSLFTYGTIAYFTAEDIAHNVITSGEIDIELLEWADEDKTIPFPENGLSDIMPGTDVIKIVETKNTGTNAAYIRVKVEKEIILPDGIDVKPDHTLVKINFDDAHWTLSEDGFYYYNEVLESGAVTEPLFSSVSFESGMDNIYQNSTVKVDVTAYAVQANNNGDNVMDANGWPEV